MPDTLTNMLNTNIKYNLFLSILTSNSLSQFLLDEATHRTVENCHNIISNEVDNFFKIQKKELNYVLEKIFNKKNINNYEVIKELLSSKKLNELHYKITSSISKNISFLNYNQIKEILNLQGSAQLVHVFPSHDEISIIYKAENKNRFLNYLSIKSIDVVLDICLPFYFDFLLDTTEISKKLCKNFYFNNLNKYHKTHILKYLNGYLDNIQIEIKNYYTNKITDFLYDYRDWITKSA
ncbi:MAG: hypothetical protein K9L17_03930 [Clostridiales bacterium]|nr:hypothetical protein [Clostridiales bacterium]MCF8021828.1 hypothetical protein [Clostridiales bacterium]